MQGANSLLFQSHSHKSDISSYSLSRVTGKASQQEVPSLMKLEYLILKY